MGSNFNAFLKMDTDNFTSIVAAGRKCIKTSRVIGNSSSPRFECFHAASSPCSEKVRSVLCMKGVDFISYDVDLSTQNKPPVKFQNSNRPPSNIFKNKNKKKQVAMGWGPEFYFFTRIFIYIS